MLFHILRLRIDSVNSKGKFDTPITMIRKRHRMHHQLHHPISCLKVVIVFPVFPQNNAFRCVSNWIFLVACSLLRSEVVVRGWFAIAGLPAKRNQPASSCEYGLFLSVGTTLSECRSKEKQSRTVPSRNNFASITFVCIIIITHLAGQFIVCGVCWLGVIIAVSLSASGEQLMCER